MAAESRKTGGNLKFPLPGRLRLAPETPVFQTPTGVEIPPEHCREHTTPCACIRITTAP